MNRISSTKYLRTCDLARIAGVHVNTVRLYEKWRLIPPVERNASGYRLFTQRHLECLLLARLIYVEPYPGPLLRRSGVAIIEKAVSGDLESALERARHYCSVILAELEAAERAADLLEQWALSEMQEVTATPLLSGEAARAVNISKDMLRHWERCGLIDAPRNPNNRYRMYGIHEIKRLHIIRMLIQAGYSTMAILRMLICLDGGEKTGLRKALDTPRPEEDIFSATDRWLSTLQEQKDRSEKIIAFIGEMDKAG